MAQSQDKDWWDKTIFYNRRWEWLSTHCRTSSWNKRICPDSNESLVRRWNSSQFVAFGFFRYKIIFVSLIQWVKVDMIFLTWFISASFLFLFRRFSKSQASIYQQIHENYLNKSMTARKTNGASSWRCFNWMITRIASVLFVAGIPLISSPDRPDDFSDTKLFKHVFSTG